jgi:voltage-gated potassium channel
MSEEKKNEMSRRDLIHEVIFEADTPAGKAFDVALLIAILLSVVVVMLETTSSVAAKIGGFLHTVEWILTIFFTIEYALRLYCVNKPLKYATSFFGVVDLLAILPTYISLILAGAQALLVIRILRLLRIFRVFKLVRYMRQGRVILAAMRNSGPKIAVFILFVLLLVTIFGSIMYLVEGGTNEGFDSIPRSIYWAIVTLTTVGYGDISPVTSFGQFIAAAIMILGYSIIAVPTGIVTAEMTRRIYDQPQSTEACRGCGGEGHVSGAQFCHHCGDELHQ